MLTNLKLATFWIVILAVNVDAQSTTTSTPAPTSTPACITSCIQSSLSPDSCTNATDYACLCTNAKFDVASIACIKANCNATERAEAVQLQGELCASYMGSVTSSSVIASSTLHSSSAAVGKVQFGYGAFMGAAAGLLGAVAGAALTL